MIHDLLGLLVPAPGGRLPWIIADVRRLSRKRRARRGRRPAAKRRAGIEMKPVTDTDEAEAEAQIAELQTTLRAVK